MIARCLLCIVNCFTEIIPVIPRIPEVFLLVNAALQPRGLRACNDNFHRVGRCESPGGIHWASSCHFGPFWSWQSLARSTGKVYYDGSSEFGSLKLSRADSCLHWRKLKCNMPKTDLQSRLAWIFRSLLLCRKQASCSRFQNRPQVNEKLGKSQFEPPAGSTVDKQAP